MMFLFLLVCLMCILFVGLLLFLKFVLVLMEDLIIIVVCLFEIRILLEGFGMFIKFIFVELNNFNVVVFIISFVVFVMDFIDGEGFIDVCKKVGEF